MVFTIYQALPDRCVPTRNNDLIFNRINWWYLANILTNPLWLWIASLGTKFTITLSLIVILAMLGTAARNMRESTRAKCNIVEFISMRVAFSLYAGWVTTATVLNTTFFLNTMGVSQPDLGEHQAVAVSVILWMIMPIYVAVVYHERNPLYGLVFAWAVLAIYVKHSDHDKALFYSQIVITNTLVLLAVYVTYLIGMVRFIMLEKRDNKCQRGLIY